MKVYLTFLITYLDKILIGDIPGFHWNCTSTEIVIVIVQSTNEITLSMHMNLTLA